MRRGEAVKYRKLGITLVSIACAIAFICASGCKAVSMEETEDPYQAELYLPRVIEEADGTLIQITPNESIEDVAYFRQSGFVPYNTYYAKSDSRGCNSCHDDLKQLLKDSPYEHPALTGLNTEWTIAQCLDCHQFGQDYLSLENVFGTMIHGIHQDCAKCWNCHDTSTTDNASDSTMYLWEDVKHLKLRGITDIASGDMPDTFTYSQDEISDQRDVFDLNAQYFEWDYLRRDYTENGTDLDADLAKDWYITVSGEVERTVTFNLAELMKDAPTVTTPIKWHCTFNPTGGPGIAQVMAKGIPLSYLLDQAGVKDTAYSILPQGVDGFQDHGGLPMTFLEGHNAMIVTEMNGEPLTWENGYPCTFAVAGVGCGCYVKQVSNLVLCTVDDPLFFPNGWPNAEGVMVNKPNVGILDLQEGQVVKTGETLTFKGYADGFDETVVAIEFSMDRGKTWKRCDLSGIDVEKWITWEYRFTPRKDTAYCFAVRAITDEGTVTPEPLEKMFIANAHPEDLV